MLTAALDAALAAIPRAAFLLDSETLEIEAANAAALAFDRERARALLRAALARHPGVRAGVIPLDGDLPRRWALVLLEPEGAPAPPEICDWRLTRRQGEVLAAAGRGLSNREIASALHCSERTVEKHLTAIFAKARVGSRSALLAALHQRSRRAGPAAT